MSFWHWLTADPVRFVGAWLILAAIVSLAVGGMISDADQRGRLDVDLDPDEEDRLAQDRADVARAWEQWVTNR